jgi:hypothetical protein
VENFGVFLLLATTDVFAIPLKNLINKLPLIYQSADFLTGQVNKYYPFCRGYLVYFLKTQRLSGKALRRNTDPT